MQEKKGNMIETFNIINEVYDKEVGYAEIYFREQKKQGQKVGRQPPTQG